MLRLDFQCRRAHQKAFGVALFVPYEMIMSELKAEMIVK